MVHLALIQLVVEVEQVLSVEQVILLFLIQTLEVEMVEQD
tara:strand:- start:128 stop:247 length:120 start_codon:yes stop_codon:yes gene_type:complete